MLTKTQRWTQGVATALAVAGLASTAWAQVPKTLQYKGEVVSRNVIVLDGQPYVSLRDLSHMVGGHLVKTDSGYRIEAGDTDTTPESGGVSQDAAGGANQVSGRTGKVGQTIFDGFWRVTVLQAPEVMDSYTSKYQQDAQTYAPEGPNDTLVVVPCRLKNGQKDRALWLCGYDTAITDDQGQSYPPLGCDMRHDGPTSPYILPGAALNAVLIFSVPKGTTLKDLIITTDGFGDHSKPSNIRISLAP